MTTPVPSDAARRAHYGDFYEGAASDGRRVLLSVGNCQAESLRAVLPDDSIHSVRVPPVHELTSDDLPALGAWLQRADMLVTQPVRTGYRGLPLGTAELIAALPSHASVVIVPVVRFAGLYPRQVIVRPPSDTSLVPPVVPYHDVSVLLEAAGAQPVRLTAEGVRAVGEESLGQLRRREDAHGSIRASDLFGRPDFGLMRTVNHPGNPVWLDLGQRVLDRLRLSETVRDPGRPLLDSIHAPREEAVIEAYGLSSAPDPHWTVGGERVDAETIRIAHLEWYSEHPDAVTAGLERHRAVIGLLSA